MPVSFNTNMAIDLFQASGGETTFPDSLKQVLNYAQNDDNLRNKKELAYLLATAKNESDYSLQRWEADFLCGERGVPYNIIPCQEAIDYYRSTDGKSNYFKSGVDSNGMAYFGRGLIQLTHKYNYDRYGKIIGKNLVADGDLALVPKNSYDIASAFLKRKTFKYVNRDDLYNARRSVNGGTKGLEDTNYEYQRWLNILEQPAVNFKYSFWTKRNKIVFSILGVGIVGVAGYFFYKGLKNV